jgi:pyruvate-formate lyase
MKIDIPNKPLRPKRLRSQTRSFAADSLHGQYGTEALKTPSVAMDDIPGFEKRKPYERYDLAIYRIAKKAPIRLCSHERISGAATLGDAIFHKVPATWNGKEIFYSISHLTLGFSPVLAHGIDSIGNTIRTRLSDLTISNSQREVLDSMKNTVESMRLWHRRYLKATRAARPDIYKILKQVPFKPARTFHEAVQSLWFTFAFTRLCGNWSGIGRIDEMLGPFLERDLQNGILDLREAREILASFFIKGCEWIREQTPPATGDAQHYQNIVLAGINAEGMEITNHVTYLVLDIVEELGISDFPITVRLNENTPKRLLMRIAKVIRLGGGIIAIYNESLVIDSLVMAGFSLSEARSFANDGCWEVQVPGKTYFTYHPFDGLLIFQSRTLNLGGIPASFSSFEELYQKYKEDLLAYLENFYRSLLPGKGIHIEEGRWVWDPHDHNPCSVVSFLTEGCIENGRSYVQGGPVYHLISPHFGGIADIGNSLYAIDQMVFKEKRISFDELMKALQNNWEGYEELRLAALNGYTYYGNDCDESDAYTVRLLQDYAAMVSNLNGRCPFLLFISGISTFGRQIEWASKRLAVPFGRKKGEFLAGNASPTPGTDAKGATTVIKSYCKADLRLHTSGAALDLKLHASSLRGENGIASLIGLMKGFVKLGGFFMQPDVVDVELLRMAQKNPQDFKHLSVRVSGWNARFVTLSKEWQDMIIEQTAHP